MKVEKMLRSISGVHLSFGNRWMGLGSRKKWYVFEIRDNTHHLIIKTKNKKKACAALIGS